MHVKYRCTNLEGGKIHLIDECLVYLCNECVGSTVVKTMPAVEKQNIYCDCGRDLKDVYRALTLAVYGTASEHVHLDIESRRIYNNSKEQNG
jgi:hypothetical protein